MIILGIETSCDETAAAVVKDGTEILSSITATSAGIHARTGGVIPEDAARKQLQATMPVLELAIKDASLEPRDIDAVAVTVGPGLIGSLLVGVETAKALSFFWKKPIFPVNHLIAHVYANWLNGGSPKFPLIALVVSGGHTDLVYMKQHGEIKLIGSTRDDAAGEAFDKTARLLGFSYPGGPTLAKEADSFRIKNQTTELTMFPRPMINDSNFDFSFSGLKTAALNKVREIYSKDKDASTVTLTDYKATSGSPQVKKMVPRISAEIQEAVVDVLVAKTLKAVEIYGPKSLLLGGGVSANSRLREKLEFRISQNKAKVKLFTPEPKLCTDNAAVIASCAFFNNNPVPWQEVSANPELTIVS